MGPAHLAAGVVVAVAPVYAGAATVVVGVDQLMHQSVVDLILAGHVVVADDYLQEQGHPECNAAPSNSSACWQTPTCRDKCQQRH